MGLWGWLQDLNRDRYLAASEEETCLAAILEAESNVSMSGYNSCFLGHTFWCCTNRTEIPPTAIVWKIFVYDSLALGSAEFKLQSAVDSIEQCLFRGYYLVMSDGHSSRRGTFLMSKGYWPVTVDIDLCQRPVITIGSPIQGIWLDIVMKSH